MIMYEWSLIRMDENGDEIETIQPTTWRIFANERDAGEFFQSQAVKANLKHGHRDVVAIVRKM